MRALIPWVRAAGAVQLVILAANFVLLKKLRCRENLSRVSPMIREVLVVHWVYIVLMLEIFACLSFWFAPELAGSTRLGRFLSAAIGEFPLQPFVHLDEMARFHGTANSLGFTLCGLVGWNLLAHNMTHLTR